MVPKVQFYAIKDAYWNNYIEDSYELNTIYDGIANFIYPELTYEERHKLIKEKQLVKIIFYSLPKDIIGGGIKWGFDDTVNKI